MKQPLNSARSIPRLNVNQLRLGPVCGRELMMVPLVRTHLSVAKKETQSRMRPRESVFTVGFVLLPDDLEHAEEILIYTCKGMRAK